MTRLISISDDAYDRLHRMKHKGESFTKVILRFAEKRRSLTDFWGALSEESADAIEKAIREGRKKHLELHIQRHHHAP